MAVGKFPQAMSDSLRSLDEIQYAPDQAAIVPRHAVDESHLDARAAVEELSSLLTDLIGCRSMPPQLFTGTVCGASQYGERR